MSGMFCENDAQNTNVEIVDGIIQELGDHSINLNHARHISMAKAKSLGLKVLAMEEDDRLQDAVLSVHHAMIHTLTTTSAFKVIENHTGSAFIQQMHIVREK